MDNYWVMNEIGKARHSDFLKQARRADRFLTSKRRQELPKLVQFLMVVFS